MSSPVDVLADVIAAIESEGIVERFPVGADSVREARAAVAELQKRLAISLRGQRIAIAMLRGERRKERAEIDAMDDNADLADAALARCKGASHA